MCKVAVRSTFTTGAVTVTATLPGLGSGAASYTILPVTAGPTSLAHPAIATNRTLLAPTIKIGTLGTMIRFYMSRPANVSVEVLDASGKVLGLIRNSKCEAGWHPVQMKGGLANGSGIYFVRVAVDGAYQSVKPVLVMR